MKTLAGKAERLLTDVKGKRTWVLLNLNNGTNQKQFFRARLVILTP